MPKFKLPVRIRSQIGPTDSAFCLGELDLTRWQVPDPSEPCFHVDRCERYRAGSSDIEDLLHTHPPPCRQKLPLQFRFHWETLRGRSPMQWCEELACELNRQFVSPADMLDLGGALRRSLLQLSFAPNIEITATG